ncbi:MAG: hypothetical protein GX085_02445 [Firmicutes bacterium]|nr:hypothetical protein [Bacillota bacterium]
MKVLFNVNEVIEKIKQGKKLLLAGDENLLRQLPAGEWIAGTIPYFMAEEGGLETRDQLFVTELPSYISDIKIKKYTAESVANVYNDAPRNGFSVIIIPAFSPTHLAFALNAPHYPNFATSQLIGWISGVHLDELAEQKPKIACGEKAEILEDGAIVMHIELPATKYADLDIINIFTQGKGDTITFPADGFKATEAEINGEKMNFADYLTAKKIDTRLPLVADYCGAMINTSFRGIDQQQKYVTFYAPVFKGIEYKIAAPIDDYITAFMKQLPQDETARIFFSCNCILNYVYSELAGKKTGEVMGPITFGEIAYQLLNQTLAYISIKDLE